MSYVVDKKYESMSYSDSPKGRTYSIPYIVHSSTAYDRNIHAARSATGMPAIGAVYEYDSGVFVSSITLNEVSYGTAETVFSFTVDYEYSDGSLNTNSGSPLTEPPKVSFATAKYQVPFEKAYKSGDRQGSPSDDVLNSAKIPFDPPAVKEKVNTIVSIQYNKSTFSGSWIQQFTDTINSSSVSIAGISVPAKCGRINEIGASNNYDENGNEYWTVSVSIEISSEPFTRKILDQGMMALNDKGTIDAIYIETDSTNKTSTVKMKSDIAADIISGKNTTKSAEPVSEPQRLNGSGKILAQSAKSVYISKEGHFAASWGTISIPRTSSKTA
ncbi:MAG TPA: hypothetical protein PKL57_17285 [Candidatus Wallbacteria bacterium]|nr:hypothetical protein [Candidatus Wallbacteria bacterium]